MRDGTKGLTAANPVLQYGARDHQSLSLENMVGVPQMIRLG